MPEPTLQERVVARVVSEVAEPLAASLGAGNEIPVPPDSQYGSVAEMLWGIATAVPGRTALSADLDAVSRAVESWVGGGIEALETPSAIRLAVEESASGYGNPITAVPVASGYVTMGVAALVVPTGILSDELGDPALPRGGYSPAEIGLTVDVGPDGRARSVSVSRVTWGARA